MAEHLCIAGLIPGLAVIFASLAPAVGAMSFTVYSLPVELRYGEVHNRLQWPQDDPSKMRLPQNVVERYARGDKLMAVRGWDADMVRRRADGTESQVKLNDHYLHHYVLYFGESSSLQAMLEAAKRDHNLGHALKGCHAMKGAGLRKYKIQTEDEGEGYTGVSFGSAAGAEYRHNPQRFEAPFRLLLRQPEVWAPTLHIINTNRSGRSGAATGVRVSPLLECPCTPQRKIDVANGTIDGRAADPPIHCSKAFAATGNPSCNLSTYVGGWRCCEHGMFVIDTAKDCRLPNCADERADEVYMKFTFYYEDAQPAARQMEGAACCDVTSDGQGNENVEYDVPACLPGTTPDQCVHVAESVQPLAFYQEVPFRRPRRSDLVDLVFAAPHLHYAGISLELLDHETNETLCEVRRTLDNSGGVIYGNGSAAGNEDGYLVGLTPCVWGGGRAPRFRRDRLMRTRAVYNATEHHTGVMGLWLSQVSAVQTTPNGFFV